MTSSAIVLGLFGLTLLFIPDEIMIYLNLESNRIVLIAFQLLGAFYFAFAMLNWMSKASLIGGIYNRPITIANLTHFLIGGLALIKGFISNSNWPMLLLVVTSVYSVYAIFFGVIFFRHPIKEKENE